MNQVKNTIKGKMEAFHHDSRKVSLQERLQYKRKIELIKPDPNIFSRQFMDPIQISNEIPSYQFEKKYPILQKAKELTEIYSTNNALWMNGRDPEPRDLNQRFIGRYQPMNETFNLRENRENGYNYLNNEQFMFEKVGNDCWQNKNETRNFYEILTEPKKEKQINIPQNFGKNIYETEFKSSERVKRVGDFEFLKEAKNILGSGTFSTVYLGNHFSKKHMKVAIKVIDTVKCQKTLIDEIYITKSISSPNVVHIFDYYLDQKKGKCYLILEFCKQGSLESQKPIIGLDLSNTSQLKDFYRYFQQILKGLRPLYDLNIIHRDLKLSNILLNDGVVKISDFGFAKHMGNFSQLNSVKCGTPSTMAPEIIFQNQTHVNFNKKSDIWSLGIILHELVYGIHPFDLNAMDMQKGKRVKVGKCYPLAEDFIKKALQFDIKKRISWEEVFKHPINYLDDDDSFMAGGGIINNKNNCNNYNINNYNYEYKKQDNFNEKIDVRYIKKGKYIKNQNKKKEDYRMSESFLSNILIVLLFILALLLLIRVFFF